MVKGPLPSVVPCFTAHLLWGSNPHLSSRTLDPESASVLSAFHLFLPYMVDKWFLNLSSLFTGMFIVYMFDDVGLFCTNILSPKKGT